MVMTDVVPSHPRFNLGQTLCLGETSTILGSMETQVRFPVETRLDWDGLSQFQTGGNLAEIFTLLESRLALLVLKVPCAKSVILQETFVSWIPCARLHDLNQGHSQDSL